MSCQHPLVGIQSLCNLFGYSRQSWYEAQKRSDKNTVEEEIVVAQVRLIREHHHKVGAEKLYFQMNGWLELKGIKIGRDKFMNILRDNGLMIQRKSRKAITTCSRHNFRLYPNLLREKEITAPSQAWVADITYLALTKGFVYLSLITDAYSRKIVGWSVHENLQTEGPLEALAKALEQLKGKKDLIHHSDRGVQYCSREYTKLLKRNEISISMTEQYDPYENALQITGHEAFLVKSG